MNKRLYARLAWQNLRKNGRFYLPYILTIIGCSGAFYIMVALAGAGDLPQMTRYSYLTAFMGLGTVVVGLFSTIFLFYTNSFLMKQRKKELGLYNILGMGKRHIAKMLAFETLYTAILGICGGLLFGLLFQKAVTALLFRLMQFEVPYGFYVSWPGMLFTLLLFGIILLVNLLVNLRRIHGQNPIELLRESNSGEREPKTKWLLTIIGVVTLGAGYYIAMAAQNALEAFALYFVAVFLVIIGTYCLFTAVSIVVLKLLRRNKRIYYRIRGFIGISGMLYRMKRNAVGLANICILSTIVLVMVSGTLSLFLGTEDALDTRYPADLVAEVRYDPGAEQPFQAQLFAEQLQQSVKEQGLNIESFRSASSLTFAVGRRDKLFVADEQNISLATATQLTFFTAAEYSRLSGAVLPSLAADEVLIYSEGYRPEGQLELDFATAENPTGDRISYRIIGRLEDTPALGRDGVLALDICHIVVADEAQLSRIYQQQLAAYGDGASSVTWQGLLDIDGSAEQQMACSQTLSGLTLQDLGSWEWFSVASRAANTRDFYSTNGGFFFLGVFLGLLFIMGTVLIIYYKQITEGLEDRERFQIMQKVGLDKQEIKRSINWQIMIVFFAPLLVAAVHVAFDFRLVRLLLTLFGLFDPSITLLCTAGTLLLFILIYSVVYRLTAKAYYRIVS